MRTLTVNTFVSLDGVMQAPGGPQEDPTNGFDLGGWNVPYWDQVMSTAMGTRMGTEAGSAVGTSYELLLGRKTYQIFAAHWPFMSDETADELNSMRKYVASRTLQSADWAHSTVLSGDAAESVASLKESTGPDLQVHGSGNLLQTLLRHRLIDTISVWTFPVLLGRGKRLFGDGTVPAGLTLESSTVSTTGVLITNYRFAGDVPVGDFQLAEPSEAELRRRAELTD